MKLLGDTVPDQYYAMTSRLTARGHQQTAMRVVTGCILILGIPALLAAGNSQASNIPGGRLLLAVVPLICLALASPWRRYRWPTRGQSTAVVMIGAVVLSAGCIVALNPFSGLLIATTFAFVVGYAALFHGTRIQAYVMVAASATVIWLAVHIGMTDIPTAIAVTTPVVMIIVAVLIACRIIAEVSTDGGEYTDVEPLTGLLTRHAFTEQVASLLGARNRDDDRYLVLVLVCIDSVAALLSMEGQRGVDLARIGVAQALRDTIRRDALVAHVDDAEFLVADTFTTPDPTPLAERIRGALAATPQGISVSIGVVSTPLRPLRDRPPDEVLDEIIALATTAMFRARRSGGNQIDYLLGPILGGDADPEAGYT